MIFIFYILFLVVACREKPKFEVFPVLVLVILYTYIFCQCLCGCFFFFNISSMCLAKAICSHAPNWTNKNRTL